MLPFYSYCYLIQFREVPLPQERVVFDNKIQSYCVALRCVASIHIICRNIFFRCSMDNTSIHLLTTWWAKRMAGVSFCNYSEWYCPITGGVVLIIFVRLDYLRRRQVVEADGCTKSRWQCIRECLFSPDIYQ